MSRNKKYNNEEPVKDYDIPLMTGQKEEKNTERPPAEEEANGPETKNGIVVDALCVKVRNRPSPDSDVIGLVEKGDVVNIIGKEKGFYNIGIGYISSHFIKEE